MQLVIGNKNYSSWSMRPWVLMKQLGIPFEEIKLRFDFSEGSAYRQTVAQYTPARSVPVLVDEGFSVWDTLAITEYLAERHPAVWPASRQHRARARCLVAEMHAGFGALRNHCPMNIEARLPDVGARIWADERKVQQDVARIEAAFADALADTQADTPADTSARSGGPFLFGDFCAADAYFAPVCTRLLTYALPVSDTTRSYMQRVLAAPGVAAWIADALAEKDYLDFEEPHRKQR